MSSQWDPTAPRSADRDDDATQALDWGSPSGSSAVPPTMPYEQAPQRDEWAPLGTTGAPASSGTAAQDALPAPQYGTPAPPYGTPAPPYGGQSAPSYGAGPYGQSAPSYGAQPSGQAAPPYGSQPFGAPGGYPGAAHPYYAAAMRDTSRAMTQLIIGIVGFFLCGFATLPAVICGALGLSGNRSQEDIDRVVRTGWIWTGVLVGVSLLLFIAYIVLMVAGIAFSAARIDATLGVR